MIGSVCYGSRYIISTICKTSWRRSNPPASRGVVHSIDVHSSTGSRCIPYHYCGHIRICDHRDATILGDQVSITATRIIN